MLAGWIPHSVLKWNQDGRQVHAVTGCGDAVVDVCLLADDNSSFPPAPGGGGARIRGSSTASTRVLRTGAVPGTIQVSTSLHILVWTHFT